MILLSKSLSASDRYLIRKFVEFGIQREYKINQRAGARQSAKAPALFNFYASAVETRYLKICSLFCSYRPISSYSLLVIGKRVALW